MMFRSRSRVMWRFDDDFGRLECGGRRMMIWSTHIE